MSIKGAANVRFRLVEADDLDFTNPNQDPIPLTGATVGTHLPEVWREAPRVRSSVLE